MLAAILIAGFGCAISFLLSVIGGWSALAKAYPASGQASGERFPFQSGKVGVVSYSNCLTIQASPDGLRLSVLFLFRVGHPPLLIPWTEMHNAIVRRLLWMETTSFDVGSPTITTLRLPRKAILRPPASMW